MTKIQPFGCDVRKASDEEKREFLELLNGYEKSGIFCTGKWNFYGIKENSAVDAFDSVIIAEKYFTRIIPISEGISILKKALGEEEKQEYEIHPISLTNGKMATFHIPKNATEADIMLLMSKLETIVANTINPPKQ